MAGNSWDKQFGQTLEPDAWNECVQMLLAKGGESVMYRGHRSFGWHLQSSLERALGEHAARWNTRSAGLLESMASDYDVDEWTRATEKDLTAGFRRHALSFGIPDPPADWDRLGWWELMQHHGAPTRLMDWTRSPFTAVWFALEDHRSGDGDMALWIYDWRQALVNHLEVVNKNREVEDSPSLELRRQQNEFVEAAIDDGNPALIPVIPRQFPRSVAQQSVLTVSPSIGVGGPAHRAIRARLAVCIRLRESWKPEMQAACRTLGLSRPGLFRDLDSLGSYVAERFFDNKSIPEVL